MSGLRVAVYTAPPIPCVDHLSGQSNTTWSPETCTLIFSENEAILLSYIYITHGHPDHFLGIPQLLNRFPEAVPLATKGTIAHMKESIAEPFFTNTWLGFFSGNQLYKPPQLANPLPDNNKIVLEGSWVFEGIECGHSDTYDSTVLWVPDLKLAVCGDVVYGDVHQMLFEANTQEKRDEWIRAVEKVEALNPAYVVPGHRNATEMDGVWHLVSTKQYIRDFTKALEAKPKDLGDLYSIMLKKYPHRFNPMVLGWGCAGVFAGTEEAKP
ncbi:metallo-beta-lactamase domain protein [Zopfia rhizophila CBS 207.26]|uniref:Metallo-beta-lactamase domain protein n=1 Tax=Zopfia rhizophila CBS 207.26 TaxID=1314779 RepID=A0A6A6DSE0_9PEZI|nr:metallo-beta-lactamase domain protein [Zopfia rhizophila CBS 207.26]